jgi:hypothetical protein
MVEIKDSEIPEEERKGERRGSPVCSANSNSTSTTHDVLIERNGEVKGSSLILKSY